MPSTANLVVVELTPGQSSKDVTVNTALADFDSKVAGLLTLDCSAGGTITLTRAQWLNNTLRLTGSPGSGFNLVVPGTGVTQSWTIDNASGQTATVKTSGGTGVAVGTGTVQFVRSDGTNVVSENPTASGGVVTMAGEVTGASDASVVSSIARRVRTINDNGTVTTNTTLSFATGSEQKITTATTGLTYQLSTSGVTTGEEVTIYSYISGAIAAGPLFTTSSGNIRWAGQTAPISSIVSGYRDIIRLIFDGTDWLEVSRSMGIH